MSVNLTLLTDRFAVCWLPAGAALPEWATTGTLFSVSWTEEETSVVCEQTAVPAGVQSELGWRAFKVAGPLDFSLTCILLSIAKPLADAGVGIFAISTYDTDYVLVRESSLDSAVAALTDFGHTLILPA